MTVNSEKYRVYGHCGLFRRWIESNMHYQCCDLLWQWIMNNAMHITILMHLMILVCSLNMTWCKKMLTLRHFGNFPDPGVFGMMYLYWFVEGILNVALVNVVTFSDVTIMDRMSSARSSCLCWKERCIETKYIVIILLPTSVFLSMFNGRWT